LIHKVRKTGQPKPSSLARDIYKSLLQEITVGAIRPGEYLSEMSLVERFRASRTPIREALIHLHKEGLLQRGPYRGYQVTEVKASGNKKLATIITEVMNQFRRFHADC